LSDAVAIGSGQLELKLAPLEIGQVLHEAVETARGLAPKRSLQLSSGEGPLWIRGDHLRLQRVFAHLLRSALAGSLDGAVEVTVEQRDAEACVRIAGSEGAASGSPSPEEASVFHPSATQRQSLARHVSHGVVAAHGGRLWVEGQGAGTAFLVAMPLVAV
jgi:signal transduction histidine kinase